MSHFQERMESDLRVIRNKVWNMGEAVERGLHSAKKVLALRDAELAYKTVLDDHPINRQSREIDRLCNTFIARHLPGAGPLREMAATSRVNVTLERIGDYAVTICREALQITVPLSPALSNYIDAIFNESIDILSDARKSFMNGNADMAIALMQVARRVQGKMDGVYETLFAEDDRMDGANMMAVFVIFNMLKRIADQAKNICDQTLFTVRGIAKLPKPFRILFLDQAGAGLGQLATAIARKNHSNWGVFVSATPGKSVRVSDTLKAFLVERGLPDEDLQTENLEVMQHDLDEFFVIVCLNGRYQDYITKVPFHTSALNWDVPGGNDIAERYRFLKEEIFKLMDLLAGDEKF